MQQRLVHNHYLKNIALIFLLFCSISNNIYAKKVIGSEIIEKSAAFCPSNTSITQTAGNTGTLVPGETISVCMETNWVIDGLENGCPWFSGMVPVLGSGWDTNSIEPIGEVTGPNYNGTWDWYEACDLVYDPNFINTPTTSGTFTNSDGILTLCDINGSNQNCTILSSGECLPAGWYFTGLQGSFPGGFNPNETWGSGNSCNSIDGPYTFCFNITTKSFADCENIDPDCSMWFSTFSDNQIGDWTETSSVPNCANEASEIINFPFNCCANSGPCDDGNDCTVEDFYDDSCNCVGILLDCATGPTNLIPCDDGDPNTINDVQTILECEGSICIPCAGTPIQTGNDCPSNIAGFTAIGEFNDSKYFISNNAMVPADLQTLAETNGGYLVTINSAEENDFIQANINEMVFIGLNDIATEETFEWFDGEAFAYDNIGVCGFCQINDANNDYTVMQHWDGKWSFSSVWNQRLGVIEIPCNNDPVDCVCTGEYAPVCGSDGITYSNSCFAACEGITTYTNGVCEPDDCICTADYDPVCGSDGVTYSNSCVAACEGITSYTTGECETGVEICDQPIDGFQYLGTANGSSYYFSEATAIPTEAEQIAVNNGGHLVTINSQSENDFVFNNINDIVYIGLNDEITEGSLEWFSSQQNTYTNFDICGFCLDNSANDDYIMMHSWNGGWSYSNFWTPRKFVVEVPCDAIPFAKSPQHDFITIEKIFPNPTFNELFVKIRSTNEISTSILLYDISGQLQLQQSLDLETGNNSIRLNVLNFPSGLYHLQIQDINGRLHHQKFVKQRD